MEHTQEEIDARYKASTFTVVDWEGGVIAQGIPFADAAKMVLTDQGNNYDIRKADEVDRWELWLSNRILEGIDKICHGLEKSRHFSLHRDYEQAEAEIFYKVIRCARLLSSYSAVIPDADYASGI